MKFLLLVFGLMGGGILVFCADLSAQKDLKAEADRHFLSAIDLRSRSNYEHSSQEFLYAGQQFLLLADQTNSGNSRAEYQSKYFRSILGICDNLNQTEKYERALVLCDAMISKLARQSDTNPFLFEALKIKAQALCGKKSFIPAQDVLQKALDLAYLHRENPAIAQAGVYHLRAKWCTSQSLWEKAQDFLEKSLSLLPEKNPNATTLQITILTDLGNIYAEQNRIYESLTTLQKGESLLAGQGGGLKNIALAHIYLQRSETFKRFDLNDSCLFYALKAIRMYGDVGAVNEPRLANAHLLAYQMFLKSGNLKEASEHIKKMSNIRSYVYGMQHVKLSEAHFYTAELYLMQRDYPKAKSELDEGYKILEQYSVFDTVQFLRAFVLYADLFTHQKQKTQAQYSLSKAKELASGSAGLLNRHTDLLWDFYRRQYTALMSVKNYHSAGQLLIDAEKKLSSDSRYAVRIRWMKLVLETATAQPPTYHSIAPHQIPPNISDLKKVDPLDRIRKLKALGLF